MLSYPRAESSHPGGSEKFALSWVDMVGCGDSLGSKEEVEEALEESVDGDRCSSFRLDVELRGRCWEGRIRGKA